MSDEDLVREVNGCDQDAEELTEKQMTSWFSIRSRKFNKSLETGAASGPVPAARRGAAPVVNSAILESEPADEDEDEQEENDDEVDVVQALARSRSRKRARVSAPDVDVDRVSEEDEPSAEVNGLARSLMSQYAVAPSRSGRLTAGKPARRFDDED